MAIFNSKLLVYQRVGGKLENPWETLLEMDVKRMFEWEIQELNGWIFQPG